MEAAEEPVEVTQCGSHKDGVRCMLSPGHGDSVMHTAVSDDGLLEWENGDEVDSGKAGHWKGYWWPDVLAIKDRPTSNHWRNQEWEPHEQDIWYRGLTVFGDVAKDWVKGWNPEETLRRLGLRKPTEPDYLFHGYLLRDVLECAKYWDGGRATWYWEDGEVWAKYKGPRYGQPWKPHGGGERLVEVLACARTHPPIKKPTDPGTVQPA